MKKVGPVRSFANTPIKSPIKISNNPKEQVEQVKNAMNTVTKQLAKQSPKETGTQGAAVVASALLLKNYDSKAVHKWFKQNLFKDETIVGGLTLIYFIYVVLGGINHDLHHWIYTGDENDSVITRLKKGRPVVFREDVYDEFFSFKHYFKTYRVHVLMAGVWLATGAYNLRNPPELVKIEKGIKYYDGWYHARLSGYTYVISSFLKAITAISLSVQSKSLGVSSYPMTIFGIWDVFSLFMAVKYVLDGNINEHRRWMIRNFSAGGGSIWVRVFGAAWALFDLNFMKSKQFYGKMNNIILVTGFMQGVLFGEYWLSTDLKDIKFWERIQILNVILTIIGARNVYKEMREENEVREKLNNKPSEQRKLQF